MYQVEVNGTYVSQARFDLLKGAAIGDTVTITMHINQGVKVERTGTIHNDGRLVQLTGNSDIYEYNIKINNNAKR